MPSSDGVIDPGYLDALAIRVHCELLRLSEELQFSRRVEALLSPLVAEILLAVYAPFALAVLAALGIYATLDWRKRYLASAIILGPFTLIRPVVVTLGAILTIAATRDAIVTTTAVLAVVGVLATEPVADQLWYAPRRRTDLGS